MIKSHKNLNKKKSNKRNKQTAPRLQLTSLVNLYAKTTSAMVNISYQTYVLSFATSTLYSFSDTSDQRGLPFSTICGSSEFTAFAGAYLNYRIKSCSVIINPTYSSNTFNDPLPMLSLSCEPQDGTSTNPTNAAFILRDQNHLFSHQSIAPKSVTFTFPTVGVNTNIWQDTDTLPTKGSIYIGNNPANQFSSTGGIPHFDALISLLVEFNSAK
jgi:hypothetical protein